MEGTVKWWSNKLAYGFIGSDTGKDIFVHLSGVNEANRAGFRSLEKGQRVTFDIEQERRGQKAINVIVIESEREETDNDRNNG